MAFLSYNQVKEYLSVLIKNNLIVYLDGTQMFKTTEKGLNLLRMQHWNGRIVTSYYNKEWIINSIFFYTLKHI